MKRRILGGHTGKIREDPYNIYFMFKPQLKAVSFISPFLVAVEECAEETIEGHAVVHLDANILQRIKQEPEDYNETPEFTCVTFQQDFRDNSLKEMLPKQATSDGGNLPIQTPNGNQGNGIRSVPWENRESLEGDDQSHVTEASTSLESTSSVTDTSGLRRSSRQRILVQRLSSQHREKVSTDFQTQSPGAQPVSNPGNPFRDVHRRDTSSTSQRVFPNEMSGQGRLGETQTSDIISDESDFFKRRFRKV